MPPSDFQQQTQNPNLDPPHPNHPRSPESQLSIPLSTTRVDKAEHSTYKSLGKVLKKLCNGRHADARGHSPEPAGRRVPWRTPHPVRPETPSRPPSVPPPPEGWPRSGCSPSRLCLRRSSSRSFVAARGWGAGLGRGRARPLATFPGAVERASCGAGAGRRCGEPGRVGTSERPGEPRSRDRAEAVEARRRARLGPEPPRARCWQALGSGAARSALSLAFHPPPLPLPPLPLLPPPSLDVRGRPQPRGTLIGTAKPPAGGGARGGAVDPRAPLGWWGGRGVDVTGVTRPRVRREEGRVCLLSPAPGASASVQAVRVGLERGLGAGNRACWGARGGGTETEACNFCLLAFHDGCAPQPTLLGSTRRDSVLPAPKGDR